MANIESSIPIAKQWKEQTAEVKVAWDLSRDCYSEMWTLAGVIDISSVICGNRM